MREFLAMVVQLFGRIVGVLLFLAIVWAVIRYRERRETRRADAWVKKFHGDLPPLTEVLGQGFSDAFLTALLPHYERRPPKKATEPVRLPIGTPIDPDEANDCPECDNTGPHDSPCRSGWKDVLRESVRRYAVAKFGSMPAWKPPCDTCGGNCGQCGESHCGICGVKPRDGKCDLVQHEAYKLHKEANPDRATMRCPPCHKDVLALSKFEAGAWSDWTCTECGWQFRRA